MMWSFLIGGAARNDRGVNGSDDGDTDSHTSGWSVDGVLMLDYDAVEGYKTDEEVNGM